MKLPTVCPRCSREHKKDFLIIATAVPQAYCAYCQSLIKFLLDMDEYEINGIQLGNYNIEDLKKIIETSDIETKAVIKAFLGIGDKRPDEVTPFKFLKIKK